MHIPRRHLTPHRLQRIILWTLAVLTCIAAVLSDNKAVSQRHQSQRFDISLLWLTHLVGKLLLIRAGRIARLRHQTPIWHRRGRDLRRAHLFRSVLGGAMRRTLKRKEPRAWIANLITILRNLDAYAAPLARRLRRRLTRILRALPPIAPAALILGPPTSPPAPADSS